MSKDKYDIILAEDPWYRCWNYVELCPWEVAVFGYCTPQDGQLYVDDVFLVPQEVCGTEVDFTTHGLPFAIDKAVEDDRLNDLRFCLHSHVNMATGFSMTDEDMIEKMGSTGTPWFASVVLNKKGESSGRVDLFSGAVDDSLPGIGQVTIEAGVYRESRDGEAELLETCESELEHYVTKQATQWNKQDTKQGGKVKQLTTGDKSDKDHLFPTGPAKSHYTSDEELIAAALRYGWDEYEDSTGWTYFFDTEGGYQGSIPPESWWTQSEVAAS